MTGVRFEATQRAGSPSVSVTVVKLDADDVVSSLSLSPGYTSLTPASLEGGGGGRARRSALSWLSQLSSGATWGPDRRSRNPSARRGSAVVQEVMTMFGPSRAAAQIPVAAAVTGGVQDRNAGSGTPSTFSVGPPTLTWPSATARIARIYATRAGGIDDLQIGAAAEMPSSHPAN